MNQQNQFGNFRPENPYESSSGIYETEQEYFLTGLPKQQDLRFVLEPETVLLNGRFVTKELLHTGGYCDLYHAFDNDRGHVVALKVATIAPGSGKEIEKLIRNELALNSRITNYKHVIRTYEIHPCTHDGANLLLLSMEYADGGSLRQWLKKNEHNLEFRRSEGPLLFKQICQGLAELHDQGILHLDLKPENILFVNGTIKIADLGVSRLMYWATHEDQQQDTNIWLKIQTSPYMSPEQFLAPHPWDIDLRSDIYSSVIILFEMCHHDCRPPFIGTPEFLRFRHLQVPAPDIPDLDENTRRAVARGLKKSPAERYQAVSDLLLDLEGRLEQSPNEEINQSAEDMWIEILEDLQAQDFDGALALCNRILDIEPEHEKAAVALADLNKRFQKARQFYSAIHAGIRNQSLDHLLLLLQEAVSVYPNHPDGPLVQMQLLSLSHEYKEAMEGAKESADCNRWVNATERIRQALQLNPGSSVVQRSLQYATSRLRLNQTDIPRVGRTWRSRARHYNI